MTELEKILEELERAVDLIDAEAKHGVEASDEQIKRVKKLLERIEELENS